MNLLILLFLAGMITIFLPCILPLVPVVVGVSISGQSRLRPLVTVLGMVISFVLFTFLLLVVLDQFVELADYIRIATYYVLLLFGVSFLSHWRVLHLAGAVAGGFFFLDKGVPAVVIAIMAGIFALEIAGSIANRIQQFGAGAQMAATSEFGRDSLLTAFIVGLTLGLVWVPCAGPALGFALALVREQPGPMAVAALSAYALGTAVPLLIVGYGGQYAVRSVRLLNRYTGLVKRIAGVMLILTAVALHMNLLQKIQVWVEDHTMFGDFGSTLEQMLFPIDSPSGSGAVSSSSGMQPSSLPKIIRAPELTGLGPWHNAEPLTMAGLKGKVVLVDFWTYSCINCIRTLPYVQGYWDKYKDTGTFVLLGVHTPEFTFEKSEKNVAMAIKEHGLTYPVAQDNDFGTWSAFANRYWPAKYLIDADGYVRYTHFGEGDYEETDKAIESLLAEIGVTSSGAAVTQTSTPRAGGPVTPETYLSSRSWPALGNSVGEPSDKIVTYPKEPAEIEQNKYYLTGMWQLVDDESQTLRSEKGEIRMRFRGGEINLVLGLEDGAKPVKAEVMVDGKDAGTLIVDRHDLFNLFKGDYGEHDVILTLTGKGVQAFAFTFGG